jgi:hypothetical protein
MDDATVGFPFRRSSILVSAAIPGNLRVYKSWQRDE